MLDGGEAVVDVTHVPMQILHAPMAAEMLIKSIEHLQLKLIVVPQFLSKGTPLSSATWSIENDIV